MFSPRHSPSGGQPNDTTCPAGIFRAWARLKIVARAGPFSARSRALIPVLQAIFFRLSVDAVNCRTPAAKAQLTKAALHAQNSYIRTVALLSDLHLQQRDRARLTVDSEPWE